ncbi:MAG TPA: DUF4129 domain-containing protein [Gemmatimonadales bacterium]|nr:DUF4129 domain-containing protein [Gemmatimonadales bacterium]
MLQAAPDSLRTVLDSVFASSVYAWRPEDETGAAIVRYWRRLLEWLASLQQANPLLFRLLVAGLVLVLLAILGHAVWLLVRTVRGASVVASGAAAVAPAVRRNAAWYFAAGDRAATEGRFGEALQLAFVGVALTLEDRGLLRYHPGKTPAECSREARVAPEDGHRLRSLVSMLYSCAFGGAGCGAAEYAAWRELAAREWHAPAH